MGVLRELEAVRNSAGLWRRASHTVLRVHGRDAVSWLQSQTTQDVLALREGEGLRNALLDRQARVLAFFTTHRWGGEMWLIMETGTVAAFLDRVATHVFLEDVQVEDVGRAAPQILVEGPRSLLFLAGLCSAGAEEAATRFPARAYAFAPVVLLGHELLCFRMSESGEDGFLLLAAEEEADALFAALEREGRSRGVITIGEDARNILRVEAGTLRYGRDVDERSVVAATPLEQGAVSYAKGCYPGQEVVARLKSYGSPKSALMGLIFEDPGISLPAPGTELRGGGQKAGILRSAAFSPTFQRWVAMASLERNHRVPGSVLECTWENRTGPARATVTPLPFHTPPTREQYARRLYEQAIERFHADANDEDTAALDLLRDAVTLHPAFEDAHEALGVILHRQGRTDEAIRRMKTLASLNPGAVMAHTNLSVFYVAKGMLREAEEEKAIARQLEAKAQLDARAARKLAEEERARLRREAEERIGMFQEVLDMDPEDAVAAMGLGSAYMQLERYTDALPWLETAVRAKRDYSAAYLRLGECLERVGGPAATAEAYRRGIEAASRKGDLMPLREMERRLAAIQPAGQRKSPSTAPV
ncbi:MAG: tetratricopeptide repeat protein [Candidatus Hydrogenedentes bacterium]|nr:tetratricopeptide repeat protein [Candidatus Hydrogenedentota bacterium]